MEEPVFMEPRFNFTDVLNDINDTVKKYGLSVSTYERTNEDSGKIELTLSINNINEWHKDLGETVVEMDKDNIHAYVDGSFSVNTGIYSFGCVFPLPDGAIKVLCGSGNDPENARQRNVTGEMLGAMNAVLCAIKSGYKSIDIFYDYQGIESWVTGAWQAKNKLTKSYSESMNGWKRQIEIRFHKVEAHTGVKYNEMADQMAKRGGKELVKPEPKAIELLENWR